MRLVTLGHSDAESAGVAIGGRVIDLGIPIEAILATPRRQWPVAPRGDRRGTPLEEAVLRAPVPHPGKIIAIGMNYLDHCAEQGIEPPKEPLVFAKFPSAVVGPGEAVSWPTDVTDVDWEVELAVVIGAGANYGPRRRHDISIAGYTIANDVSARDLQTRDGQFVRAKSLDTFCPLGPFLVSADEVPHPGQLGLSLQLNGLEMQRSNTDQLIFGVSELFDFCRRYFTLDPGDIILTGTPPGVGVFRTPPVFLAAGDVMVAAIDGLGELRTPVAGHRPEAEPLSDRPHGQ